MSELTKLADIQVSIIQYKAYAAEASILIRKMQGKLAWYNKLKELTDSQVRNKDEAERIIAALSGFQQVSKAMLRHFENRESEAWEVVVRNNEQHIEGLKIMQRKYLDKCQEANELREMLHSLIRDLAA